MVLTLRPTGLQSPAYEDWADYSIYEDGDRIGRLYEDRAAATQPELRWFWSITVVVDARAGVRADGPHGVIRGSEGAIPRELGEVESVGQNRRTASIRLGRAMSAFGGKADMTQGWRHVCL
jgi:hypothetical protein